MQKLTEFMWVSDDDDKVAEVKRTCFKFGKNDHTYLCDCKNDLQFPSKRFVYQTKPAEHVTFFWRLGLSFMELIQSVT